MLISARVRKINLVDDCIKMYTNPINALSKMEKPLYTKTFYIFQFIGPLITQNSKAKQVLPTESTKVKVFTCLVRM